ncbi:hypothetical protein HMPREF1989_00583 [Porphyromonas gingivalis F0566]|nr:hypothetical protein HMPREF1989_00583 [Porphyromonas gingivalis F0566]
MAINESIKIKHAIHVIGVQIRYEWLGNKKNIRGLTPNRFFIFHFFAFSFSANRPAPNKKLPTGTVSIWMHSVICE